MKFCSLIPHYSGFTPNLKKNWVPTFTSQEKKKYFPHLSRTVRETFQLIFFLQNYNSNSCSQF